MALKGNLSDFPIIQILNLINLAKKSGGLLIQISGKGSIIHFQNGKLVCAQYADEDNNLVAILYRKKKISRKQSELIRKKAGKITDKQLGLMLVNSGYLSQVLILQCLKDYYLSVVRRYLTETKGTFEFISTLEPPPDRIPVRMGLENVIIEGTRQLHESEVLKDEIPSLEMAAKFKKQTGVDIQKLQLSVQEWKVVKFITPKNSFKQIAHANNMNDLEIRRVILTLLQAGVIEMVRSADAPKMDVSTAIPNTSKQEQRSIINRLINRLKTA